MGIFGIRRCDPWVEQINIRKHKTSFKVRIIRPMEAVFRYEQVMQKEFLYKKELKILGSKLKHRYDCREKIINL